mmetsp:Transcript_14025/g.16169  ORF Transcript_14025/g.16169 Transcript_14025/m.16169 type:complete len:254 (-) Transcript_14025:3-764(-)
MKVALVTGGAQGIGRGLALKLLGASPDVWSVVVVDKCRDGLSDFLLCVEKTQADKVLLVEGDTSKRSCAVDAIEQTISRFSRLDLLVNNAGGGGLGIKLEDVSEEQWHSVVNSNLSSTFFFSQIAAPHLERHRGSIVNISSTRSIQSEPDSFPYAAAKGGVESLTHALAASLANRVNVNCLRLGWIDVSSRTFGPGREQIPLSDKDHSQHFAGRVGVADDVADAILFLSRSPFICGEVLTVDGGMTRKMIYHE